MINVRYQFSIMRDSTRCLNDDYQHRVFNSLCLTLYEKWNVDKPTLAKLMAEYGYTYTENCCICGYEYEWDNVCQECSTT